jgi:hypothetical protein
MKDGAGVSQFGMYAGFEGIDYGFGGGMADYGNPFLHAEHGVRDLIQIMRHCC